MSADGQNNPGHLTHFEAPSRAYDNQTHFTDCGGSNSSLQTSSMTDADRMGFSPCGTLLVGCWQMQHGPGTFEHSAWPPDTDSRLWQRPWQLWHGSPNAGPDAERNVCSMRTVAASDAEFRMASIAFHPHPSCHRIYAVADTAYSIHLIDGYAHRRMQVWTWQQLSQQPGEYSGKFAVQLKWSWDGSQLAVLAPGLTALITFGGSHCPA